MDKHFGSQDTFATLAHRLSAVTTRKEAALAMFDAAEQLFGWDACYLSLYPEGDRFTDNVVTIDTVDGYKREFESAGHSSLTITSLAHRILTEGARLRFAVDGDDASTTTEKMNFGDVSRRSASAMYAPIRQGNRSFGIASIQSYKHGVYGEESLKLFQTLADTCSGALARTMSEAKLRQQAVLTRQFAELGRRLSGAMAPDEAAMVVLETADVLLGWDACFVNLYSQQQDRLIGILSIDSVEGRRRAFPPQLANKPPGPIVRRTLREGGQLILRRDPDSPSELRDFTPYGDRKHRSASLMYVPMRIGSEGVGILSIQSYRKNAYTATDLETLQALADHCGGALQRAFSEKQLRENEQRLRLVTAQLPAVIWTLDAELQLTMVEGEAFSSPQGRRALVGQDVEALFSEVSTCEAAVAGCRQALRGVSGAFEAMVGGRLYQCHVSPLYGPSREIIGCVGVGHNITKRKEAERELKKAHDELERRVSERTRELSQMNLKLKQEIAERRRTEVELERWLSILQATLESTTDGIAAVDRAGALVNWNGTWQRMWSGPAEPGDGLHGRPMLEVVLPDLCDPAFLRDFEKSLTEEEREFSSILELADGRVLEYMSKPRLINRSVVGRVWSFRDVTLRQRAEEALARSEANYRQAITSASGVPYRLIYSESNYDFVGEEIEQLIGIAAEDITRTTFKNLVREVVIMDREAPQEFRDYVDAFHAGHLSKFQVDLRLVTPQGEEKWINDCCVPVREESTGRVIGSLGILQDITQRKIAEEQHRMQQERLTQTEKLVALGTLVSGAAHEINNPNNFIMLNTPILSACWDDASRVLDEYWEANGNFLLGGLNYSEMRQVAPELFRGVTIGAQRIATIIQELRDFSRQSRANCREHVDMAAVIRSALVLLKNTIERSTDCFRFEVEGDVPPVEGQFQRLEQVVINLVQNACQALTSPSQEVRVLLKHEEDEDAVVLEVRDQGVGIQEDILKRITDPFFTTKRDSGGTGLGLSICSRIVHDHGGSLSFESIPGCSTQAVFRLPAARAAQNAVQEES